ncbi:MAG TPA: amidohydrolase [Candidatus Limnocylindrales bacterium]|nr:amidohydrolase [Candidatus Limnocylindrales bacterium]
MSQDPRATLVIRGRIASLAGPAGPGWVEAIGIAGGRVVAAGSRDEVDAASGPGARVMELAPDEAAVPGLTDSHLHLVEAAVARTRVQLEDAGSVDELLARVRDGAGRVPDPDGWIEGAGWDADTLGRWPTADDLERAVPGRRVALWAHDHHALLASHRALADAGVGEGTPDPAGGVIRRDGATPTGVLHEAAARLVAARVPPPGVDALAAAMRPLIAELLALGVVAAHDPGGLSEQRGLEGPIAAYRALAAAGELGIRAHPCIRPEQLDAAAVEGLRSGFPLGPDPLGRLRMGWLKTFADGSLGSRTAALLEPLLRGEGEPEPPNGGYGVWLTPPEELRAQVARAASLGITTQIHGIGDAAVRAALDALGPSVGATALVPRVEHAQLVHPDDVPRFAALGIAASLQPVHVRSDEEKARRLWGSRAEEGAYALGAIARTGALIPTGTDAPVEPIDPWPGVACSVTRSAPTWPPGTPPLGPSNALDLWRALRAACVDPALSASERDRGRLVPGHRADVVVLPAAALAEPVEVGGALWHARPRLVLVDGEAAAGGT